MPEHPRRPDERRDGAAESANHYNCGESDNLITGTGTFINAADGTSTPPPAPGARGRSPARWSTGPGRVDANRSWYHRAYYAAGGTIAGPGYLYNTTFYVDRQPGDPDDILLGGTGDTLETNVLPNTTLWVQGNDYLNGSATLNVPNGLVNHGTMLLGVQLHTAALDNLATGTAPSPTPPTAPSTPSTGTGGPRRPSPARWSTRA